MHKNIFESKLSVFRQKDKLIDLYACIGVFLFAILLYANTFNHGWVLDDNFLFKANKYVTAGISGFKDILLNHSQDGANFLPETFQYRPVSQLLFALEWEISPDNTVFYHVMNVIWNAVGSLLLYLLLRMMFWQKSWLYSLIITLIFTANPMHTEVVANIKSRDELCYFVFLLLAIISALKYFENKRKVNLLWLFVCYTLAFFSKESAITALVAIPLFMYFFGKQNDRLSEKTKNIKGSKSAKSNSQKQSVLKSYFIVIGLISLSVIFYLLVRYYVLNVRHDYYSSYVTLMQNFLADQTLDIRWGSAVWLMGKYLLLAFVPYQQSCDYSFAQLPYVGLWDWRFLLVFLLYFGMLIYVIYSLFVKKEKSVFVFGILFWVVTMSIYSNTVCLIGSSFADRFLFVPILATAIVFVEVLWRIFKINNEKFEKSAKSLSMIGLLLVMIGLFSAKTVVRAGDWKDSFSLYSTDAPKVTNSARIKYYLGDAYRDISLQNENVDSVVFVENMRKAISIYKEGIRINENYSDCYERLGFCYLRLDSYYPDKNYGDSSIYYLDKSIELFEYEPVVYFNRAEIAYNKGDYEMAKKCYSRVIDLDSEVYDSYFKVANTYYELGIYDTAIMYYIAETERDSTRSEIFYNMGFCYSELSKMEIYTETDKVKCLEEAIRMYDKALKISPQLFVAYSGKLKALVGLGKWSEVIDCGKSAIKVNPNHDDGYFYSGVAECQLNRFDDAEQNFNKAIKCNPDNYIAYFNLAYLYSLKGNMSKSKEFQQRGNELQIKAGKAEK